jgi:hypothetical protein
VHGPRDLGLLVGELLDRPVVMVSEDPTAGGLPLHPAKGALEPVRRVGHLAAALGADEELVWDYYRARAMPIAGWMRYSVATLPSG